LFVAEQNTPKEEGQLSAEKFKEAVELEYGAGFAPSVHTIQTVYKEGMAGISPVKVGQPSAVEDFTFLTLTNALETFMVISQINGQGGVMSNKILSRKINFSAGQYDHMFDETVAPCAARNRD
jgi:hypothetical protein